MSGLEDHGFETRYTRYRPIQPEWLAKEWETLLPAYIQLHLVARDLQIDIVQLE
jgi:hypothetical protein